MSTFKKLIRGIAKQLNSKEDNNNINSFNNTNKNTDPDPDPDEPSDQQIGIAIYVLIIILIIALIVLILCIRSIYLAFVCNYGKDDTRTLEVIMLVICMFLFPLVKYYLCLLETF